MNEESRIGMNMYVFEVSQIRAGKRPPLPNTPSVGALDVSVDKVYSILATLHKMYGHIDEKLLTGLGVENLEVLNRRLYQWSKMHGSIRVENFSCL